MDEQTNLGFSVNMEGIDRDALLAQAALELDALHGHLGNEPAFQQETPEGAFVRGLAKDVAEFDKKGNLYPYKITKADFTASKVEVPVRFLKLAQEFDFYEMRIPFNLWPRPDWAFNYLEMQVELDAPGASQPAIYQILPAKQFQDMVSVDGRLEVRLGENFEFQAAAPPIIVPTGIPGVGASARAEVEASVKSGAGVVIGPFIYHWKKTKINNDGVGTRRVFWRIDGAEFFQENDLNLLVIVQTPKVLKELTVDARMIAGRYFSLANSNLQRAVKQLPEALRTFFQNGAPIPDQHSWTVSLL